MINRTSWVVKVAVDIAVVAGADERSVAGRRRRSDRLSCCKIVCLRSCDWRQRSNHFEFGEGEPIIVVEPLGPHEPTIGATRRAAARMDSTPGADCKRRCLVIVLERRDGRGIAGAIVWVNRQTHVAE